MNKKESRIIVNTFDAPTDALPSHTVSDTEYLALGGIASIPLAPGELERRAQQQSRRLAEKKAHNDQDMPPEGVGSASEARLHPYQLRD